MLSPYQPKVQQKLAHANLLLESCRQCGDQLPERQKREAFLTAAVMQTGVALVLYIKELASRHALSGVSRIHTLDQLVHELQQLGVNDPAVSELQRLSTDGWLSDLLILQHQALYPDVNDAGAAVAVDAGLIASSAIQTTELNDGLVFNLISELTRLIERQRHANLEY
ncbi:MAG: hypothetical protein AseanaTS_24290 [Candidatus Pelagadaptatus aseana]|uniref:DUF6586 family protein n=1 Tax=Candidatus Pelagadaptatus aseana TaxID=3120508 RepID=UPI0039B345F8